MILPSDLKPLPVASEDKPADSDCFVSETTVKQLLVGPLSVAGPGRPCALDGSYAGIVAGDSPFVRLAGNTGPVEAPARPFDPSGGHPALAGGPRAAPPVPRVRRPASSGASGGRWMAAMGLAAATMLAAGLFLGFTSDSATDAAAGNAIPRPAEAAPAQAEPAQAIALSDAGRGDR